MTLVMMAKVMLEDGFKLKDGLKKYKQGEKKLLKLPKNVEKFRLGYKLIRANKIRVNN